MRKLLTFALAIALASVTLTAVATTAKEKDGPAKDNNEWKTLTVQNRSGTFNAVDPLLISIGCSTGTVKTVLSGENKCHNTPVPNPDDPSGEGPVCYSDNKTFYAYAIEFTCNEGGGTFYVGAWGQDGASYWRGLQSDWGIIAGDHCLGDQYGNPTNFDGVGGPDCIKNLQPTGRAQEVTSTGEQLPEGVHYIVRKKNKDMYYSFPLELKN